MTARADRAAMVRAPARERGGQGKDEAGGQRRGDGGKDEQFDANRPAAHASSKARVGVRPSTPWYRQRPGRLEL